MNLIVDLVTERERERCKEIVIEKNNKSAVYAKYPTHVNANTLNISGLVIEHQLQLVD